MTSTHCHRSLLAIVVGALCVGVLLLSPLVARAYGEELGGYYYTADGGRVDAKPGDAWTKALELQTGMGITGDYTPSGHLYVNNGKKVFVELNGHVLNRNLSSCQDDGEVFYVEDNATLTVYGGAEKDLLAGEDIANTVRAWVTDSSGNLSQSTTSVRGGVITGGYSGDYAGGIEMRENATVNLDHVTVCGNRAEQSGGSNGYGGGVNMSRDYGKLNMDHASIVYNYAYNEGGGVFVNGGSGRKTACNCTIRMNNSHIDYNGADDNGAGIAVRGEKFQLIGDAKQVTSKEDYSSESFWSSQSFHGANAETVWGSTIAYNIIQDSEDNKGGAGVYLWNDDCTVNGANVFCNKARRGGMGGGIFTMEENISIVNCNVTFNIAEEETYLWGLEVKGGKGGGIFVDNDLVTVSGCTVACNKTDHDGAGIWVNDAVNLIVGGTLVVQGNALKNGTTSNVFLAESTTSSAYLVADGLVAKSLVGITLEDGHNSKVACGTSARAFDSNAGETIDQRMFTSDGNAKYLYWNSETNPWYDSSVSMNTSRDSYYYDERWLVALDRSKMPANYDADPNVATREFEPDAGSALKRTGSYKAGSQDYDLYEGVFGMPNFMDDSKDLSVSFFYSDGYFMQDPKQYNEHLATMSFALALAAGYSNMGNKGSADDLYNTSGKGSTYYPIKSSNVVELLEDLGVEPNDVYINEYNKQKPTTSSMGVAIGSKKIGDKTLVILGTRGTGYEAEWASNVTLGASGEAEGFKNAATIAFGDLQKYLSDHNIDGSSQNTLFWLSGFSRAGATANLTAKRIVDAYDNEGNRTYAYPMEAPKGGLDSEEKPGCDYTCIHNVINNEDIVPYVAPTEMGFKRYGVDHYMPGTQADSDNIKAETYTATIYDSAGNVARTIPVTSRRDNDPLTGSEYKKMRSEMVKQLRSVNADVIYDDYFYQATINFVANTTNGSNITSLIGEINSDSPEINSAAYFISRLFGNILSQGFNYNLKGTHKTNDYRRFFASEYMTGHMTFQQAASTLCGIVFSLDSQELDGVMEVFGHIMDRIDAGSLYLNIFANADDRWTEYEGYYEFSSRKVHDVTADLWRAVSTRDEKKGYKSLYDVLDESKVDQIRSVWSSLMFPLLTWAHFDYQEGDSLDSTYVGTLAYNAMRIIQNHYPEVVVSYLRASDDYYKDGNNSSYQALARSTKSQEFDLAVDVAHVAHDGTTTVEAITQDNLNKNILLTSPNDTITLRADPFSASAQVWYQYEGTDEWHQFNKPLTFPAIMQEGTVYGMSGSSLMSNITFYAFTSRHKTKQMSITVAYDVYGQLELGNYVAPIFGFRPHAMAIGDSYTLDAADSVDVPDSAGTVARFVRWRVERYDEGGSRVEVESDDELASILGEDFDAHAAKTTLTLMKKERLRIVPLFREYEHVGKLHVAPTSNDALGSAVDLVVYGSDATHEQQLPARTVAWRQDGVSAGGRPTYVGEVKLALSDLCPINDGWKELSAVGWWFADDQSQLSFESETYEMQDLTLLENECILRIRMSSSTDANPWKLVVTPSDVVTGKTYEDQTFYATDAPGDYRPDAPLLPNEEFCGWADGWTVDEATHTKTIEAWYRPVVDHVTLTLNQSVVLGEGLPRAERIELRSGETTWQADAAALSSAWRIAGSVGYQSDPISAQARVAYEAAYGLTDFAPRVELLGSSAPAASFGVASNCAVVVRNGEDSLEVLRAVAKDTSASGGDLLTVSVRFAPVLSKVTSVNAGSTRIFPNGVPIDELCDALEGVEIQATVEGGQNGVVHTLRPSAEGYEPAELNQQSFTVVCELTSDEFDLGECGTVEIPVTVLSGPQAQVPSFLPDGGVYAESVRLVLTHPDERATIRYAVQAVPVVTGENGEDQTEVPSFDSADFVEYDGIESVVFGSEHLGKRVFVCAYASQEGLGDSDRVVRSFEVMDAYEEVPYVNATGQNQNQVLARCLTASDAKNSYWSQESGGWYAVTEDLTISDRVWVQGEVNLILCDGATLELANGADVLAVAGASLTMWCQQGGTGKLIAGHEPQEQSMQTEEHGIVVIPDSAMTDNAAGIGSRDGLAVGTITINGGAITCYGGKGAAGIGGCANDEGHGVTINNGTVTAIGGEGGAGIGSGPSGHVEYVRITGGTVVATGGSGGAGIGGNVGTVSLSLAHAGDSITAGSYACDTLELQNDLRFSDGANTVTAEEVLGSSGKTLVLNPIPSVKPSFKTMSLVLSGQIGVNFFMDLPAIDGVDYTQSYMEFMVGERKAARADYDARKKSEDGLYYGFTCYVSSIQMAEPITATFHYDDGRTVTCTNVSVENYARLFEKNASDNPGKYSEEAVNLVHAIVDYGYYMQLFLSEENGWEIGTDYAAMDYPFSDSYGQDEISGLVDEYDSQADLGNSGISDVTIRLSLDSSTTLEFLFTAPEECDVCVYDDAYKLTQVSDTRWCITVPNISAHKLGDTVTVSGGTNQDGYSFNASPLAYIRIALNSSTVSDTGKTALCAFYKYYEAAMAYRDSLVVAL